MNYYKYEVLTPVTRKFLIRAGYLNKGLNYPRFDGIKYLAKEALNYWRANKYTSTSHAKRTILAQTFSGITPEWLEKNQHLL